MKLIFMVLLRYSKQTKMKTVMRMQPGNGTALLFHSANFRLWTFQVTIEFLFTCMDCILCRQILHKELILNYTSITVGET